MIEHTLGTVSQNYVVLANHDFDFVGEFTLIDKIYSNNHCFIYTGYENGSWAVGLNAKQYLTLWIGDGITWKYYENYELPIRVQVGYTNAISIKRRKTTLQISVDNIGLENINLPQHLILWGSRLGIGCIKKSEQSSNLKVGSPVITLAPRIKSLEGEQNFRNRIHLVSIFYGAQFAQWLCNILVPSLLLDSNIPAMAGKKIVHKIYCSSKELPLIQDSIEILQQYQVESHVNIEIIPSFGNQRDHLFLAVNAAILEAITEDAVIVMAQPDHVFGHGLAAVIDKLEQNEFVVCGHPRVNARVATLTYPDFIKNHRSNGGKDNLDFVSLAVDTIPHVMVKNGMEQALDYWHGFRKENNFSVFFKEPPPLCFHPDIDLLAILIGTTFFGEFESLDHDFTEYAFQRGKLRVIDDSREFFWSELTDEFKYNPTIQNNYWPPSAQKLFEHELKWYFA